SVLPGHGAVEPENRATRADGAHGGTTDGIQDPATGSTRESQSGRAHDQHALRQARGQLREGYMVKWVTWLHEERGSIGARRLRRFSVPTSGARQRPKRNAALRSVKRRKRRAPMLPRSHQPAQAAPARDHGLLNGITVGREIA